MRFGVSGWFELQVGCGVIRKQCQDDFNFALLGNFIGGYSLYPPGGDV